MESVVAFDAEGGVAYVVVGLAAAGALVRLIDVAAKNGFEVQIWQQVPGSKDEAYEWARRHVKVVYEDAAPLDLNDPRPSPRDGRFGVAPMPRASAGQPTGRVSARPMNSSGSREGSGWPG